VAAGIVDDMDLGPGRGEEDPAVAIRGISPRSKKTGPASRAAASRSSSAIAIARRAKPAGSLQGIGPPAATIRRPGSATVAKPRRASASSSVDLPPPEQPEMAMRRARTVSPCQAGP
jgi:hypothetical protein